MDLEIKTEQKMVVDDHPRIQWSSLAMAFVIELREKFMASALEQKDVDSMWDDTAATLERQLVRCQVSQEANQVALSGLIVELEMVFELRFRRGS